MHCQIVYVCKANYYLCNYFVCIALGTYKFVFLLHNIAFHFRSRIRFRDSSYWSITKISFGQRSAKKRAGGRL